MTSKTTYETGILIRFGEKANQTWKVRWDEGLNEFLCACPKGTKGELCWHRDDVVKGLAQYALKQLPDVGKELRGKLQDGISKRKLKFDDPK